MDPVGGNEAVNYSGLSGGCGKMWLSDSCSSLFPSPEATSLTIFFTNKEEFEQWMKERKLEPALMKAALLGLQIGVRSKTLRTQRGLEKHGASVF